VIWTQDEGGIMDTIAKSVIILLFLFSFCCVAEKVIQAPVTTATLFEEMVDMFALTYFPEPAFKTVQYSSYDRRSNLPGGPDWFANSDGFGGEPQPNFEKVLVKPDEEGVGEYLIAELEGPGAVVRLWSAAIEGIIRLYLDDLSEPVYDGPALDFFHRFYDSFTEIEEIDSDRFRKTIYQRDACYAPIPFSQGMRLIWKGDVKKIHFYQVGVRLYEKGTQVISFNPQDISEYRSTIDGVTSVLLNPDEAKRIRSKKSPIAFECSLNPSEKAEVSALDGPQAVEVLTVQLKASDLDRALRQTVMSICVDGSPRAQVESPVGDFFGTAPGINPYFSLPFIVEPDGTMSSRFVMPFGDSFRLSFENFGEQEVSIQGSVLPVFYDWDETRSMFFRARWRIDHGLIASGTDVQDLPFLIASGKGVYVGTVSYLLNPNDVPTPYGSWWGEGDEKVFIDGEPLPSTFGTGSEDYYNYSWSSPDIFYFPYCGQPRNDGPGNRGFVTNYRWHILDPLPFKEDIRFYMELKSHERTPGLSYARMGYHYAQPGITDDHTAIMPGDVRHLELPFAWEPAPRMGARNSEFFQAERVVDSRRQTHLSKGSLWAGGEILTWAPQNRGEAKSFSFTVEETGNIRLHIVLALTAQSGEISFLLDGEKTVLSNRQETLDLYRPYRTLLRNFTFPTAEFEAGRHRLTILFEGADPQVENPQIGIDFLWVQKQ
jgi:hypothetical protein